MTDTLRIAAAQLDPTVGDVIGNTKKALKAWEDAKQKNADLIAFSELFILGYNPEDLVKKPDVLAECRDAIDYYVKSTKDGPDSVIGAPYVDDAGDIFNAAYHISGGVIKQIVKKHDLPNYGVFDDKRLFASGDEQKPITVKGVPVGIMICEDTWFGDVAQSLVNQGAQFNISINGSPWEIGKESQARMHVLHERVAETGVPLLYINQIGGQDGVIYDGHSLALNTDQSVAYKAPGWQEHVGLVTAKKQDGVWALAGEKALWGDDIEQLYAALVLGTRDYIKKNGFTDVVLGLSGGADSALVAALAADAIGADHVKCVRLPSEFTSGHSMGDAEQLAKNLGVKLTTLPIIESVKAVGTTLTTYFGEDPHDLTGQNVQARLRGLFLMAITNQYKRHMLLTTGNKSEMAVGYATLYGDMSGGFNPIKDVYKTKVFELMEYRNRHKPAIALGPEGAVIPRNIITKPPTAELKPGQTDEGELGIYPKLDGVLHHIIERETPIAEIAKLPGVDSSYVSKIYNLVDIAEFKRRQAAPGNKVTSRALYGDRRYPVTNGFRTAQRLTADFARRMTLSPTA